jgi:hypothetical protein
LRKLIGIVALVFALGIPAVALSADLNPSQVGTSSSCDGTTVWHFVNNQTGGAGAGVLEATFSGDFVSTGPSSVLNNTQHFIVETTGDQTLLGAETNLPGRLVLSDVDCEDGKKDKK